MTSYAWIPNDGNADSLAVRMRKAGQLNVAVDGDAVSMFPFEEPGHFESWREAVEAHFRCTLQSQDGNVV